MKTLSNNGIKKVSNFKKAWPIYMFLANSLIFPIIFAMIMVAIGTKDIEKAMGLYKYPGVIVDIAVILGAIYYYKKIGLDLFKEVKFKWWFILLPLGAFAFNMIQNNLLELIFGQVDTLNGQTLAAAFKSNLVLSLITAVIVAPVLEEIVFRGVLLDKIFKEKVVLGFLFSGILFSLMHAPTNLYSFFNYFNMAMCFAAIYKISGNSLKWVIFAHMLNNAISVIMGLMQ